MPDITMPDGQVVRFPDTMSREQISGLIASKYPKEVGAAVSAQPQRDQSQAFPFEGSNVPGYDPATGIVSGGAIDDKTGQEFGIGIRRGLESLAGLPGDVGPMIGLGARFLAGKLGADPKHQQTIQDVASYATPFPLAASTETIREDLTDPLFGRPDDPLTTKGQVARTFGEFAPGAFGPGGPLRKAGQMLLPAIGSETGAAVAPEGYEDLGRFAGSLVGGALTVPKIGGKPIADAAKDLGVKTKDMTRIIKRMQQDGMSPQQIQARLAELGPDATLMDVGPNLRQEGQRIYAQGGRGRGIIDETLTPRDRGANARIRGEVDANLGPAPVPSHVEAQITQGQEALSPAYESVLRGAQRVDTTPIAHRLESEIVNLRGRAQQVVQRVRGMLNISGANELDPNPRTLFETRKAIDGMIATETDTNALRVLSRARSEIDQELARAVPGIKDVDAQFSELARQRDALGRGQQALDSGRTAPRPAELAADVQGGALPQGTQVGPSAAPMRLRQGARAEIDRIIGTNANDRVALQRLIKGEGDWNRERLATLFGQDRADRLISVLDRERTFAETSNRIMKNSATAERLPEGGGMDFGMLPSWKSGGMLGLARAVASEIGEAAFDKMRASAARSRDENVAGLLSTTDRNRLVTAIIKANGGKALPQDKIESAVRALLLTSGATAKDR